MSIAFCGGGGLEEEGIVVEGVNSWKLGGFRFGGYIEDKRGE